MQRYKNTGVSNYKKNKRNFNTTIYKEVPKKDTDEYFIAQDGDRCDNTDNEYTRRNISKNTYINRKC